MTNPLPNGTIKCKRKENTRTPSKCSIKKRWRTDFGRSAGVATVNKLVWLNWFKGPTDCRSRVIKRIHIENCVNSPPYKDRGQTANHSGKVIKSVHKYIKWQKLIFCLSEISSDIRLSYLCRSILCTYSSVNRTKTSINTLGKTERGKDISSIQPS